MQTITDHADFAQALARFQAAAQVVRDLEQERADVVARARATSSAATRFELSAELTRLDAQLHLARLREQEAGGAVERARLDARQSLAELFAPRIRDAARALEQALLAAAEANDQLVAVIEEFRAAGGDGRFDEAAWRELRPESPRCATRLAAWRRWMQASGWL